MIRGFEKVSTYNNVKLPQRGTNKSAGYDFYINEDVIIEPEEIVKIKTGVKAYMLDDEVLEIYVRSSMGLKGLVLMNTVGIIDSDYYNNNKNEGEIMFFIKNTSQEKIELVKNERITQGIFKKYLVVDNDEFINDERVGGFGSTTK